VVFEDTARKHTYLAKKDFNILPDGKHQFTSAASYHMKNPYTYSKMKDKALAEKIEGYVERAFTALHERDYAKFDIRVDSQTSIPYITDANPNTAFGPHMGLPFTEILAMYNVKFNDVLSALISKYARKIEQQHAS
jgi:D-alanine-D-alanine ligase-like ATP-grasp enzyme